MRNILIALILLVGVSFAQTTGKYVGKSIIFTDSLGYSGSDTLVVADSSMILDLGFQADWLRVFIKGNANSSVDSIGVRFGSVRYTPKTGGERGFDAVDTVWGSYFSTMKDSAYNNCATIINNTVGKDYFLLAPAVQLIEFKLLNYRAALATRNTILTIQAVKD